MGDGFEKRNLLWLKLSRSQLLSTPRQKLARAQHGADGSQEPSVGRTEDAPPQLCDVLRLSTFLPNTHHHTFKLFMDVDKLFKLPKLPNASLNKRNWSEPTNEALKAARVDDAPSTSAAASSSSASAAARPRASVADGSDEEGGGAGSDGEFAPGNDADYFVDEDDEGGRFFGGGLTNQQKRIIEIMAMGDQESSERKPEEELRDLRRALLRFEKAVNKNAESRVSFIESEADLDSALKALVVLTTNPALFYPEALRNNLPSSICSLLTHENVDIVGAAVELIEELTDDDVLDAGEVDADEEGERKGEAAVLALVDGLLEASFIDLLIPNLLRLNDIAPPEADATAIANAESDANAIYHLLGSLENLLSLKPAVARPLVDSALLKWLLQCVGRKGKYEQNRGYAAELLAVLVQGEEAQYVCEKLGSAGGMDDLLQVLSKYRKHDPTDAEEIEFLENLFDILCATLATKRNKLQFYESEGTELMCIFLKEKRASRLRAIKVLDFALSGPAGAKSCERFVDSGGLGPLFSLLMGKGSKKHDVPTLADEEHMLGLIASLLNNLPSDDARRIRLLAKCVEEEYAKLDRLLEMRASCEARIKSAEREIEEEKKEMEEQDEIADELLYLRKLDAGLHQSQQIAYVLAWLCMEDDGVTAHLKAMLARAGETLDGRLVETLKEYYAHLDDDVLVSEPDKKAKEEEPLRLKDVIVELVNYLLSA